MGRGMKKRWANRLHRKADRFKAELWRGNEFGLKGTGVPTAARTRGGTQPATNKNNNKCRALMSGGHGRKN